MQGTFYPRFSPGQRDDISYEGIVIPNQSATHVTNSGLYQGHVQKLRNREKGAQRVGACTYVTLEVPVFIKTVLFCVAIKIRQTSGKWR